MSILLCFNEADSWTVGALAEATKIKMDLLVQVLLIILKAKLLVVAEEVDEEMIDASTIVPRLQEQEAPGKHQRSDED